MLSTDMLSASNRQYSLKHSFHWDLDSDSLVEKLHRGGDSEC